MSIVAAFSVDSASFALGHALQTVPEMRVEGELMVSHSDEWVMPFLWAAGDSFERFEDALSEDTTVAEAESINQFDSTRLYRFEWADEIRQIIREILDQDGMLLEATAQDEVWDIKIRFAHREQLSALQEYFDEQASAFTLERLYEPEEPEQGTYNLTSEQREALLLALDSGYFAVPRETTADELAEMLGVSTSAVSERLRRAYAALVTNTLTFDQRPARQTGSWQSEE